MRFHVRNPCDATLNFWQGVRTVIPNNSVAVRQSVLVATVLFPGPDDRHNDITTA